MQFKAVTLLAAFAGLAQAQTFTSTYVDPVNGLKYQSATENGITFGVALPATSNPTELVVQMRAPASVGWVGGSLGGSMKYSLLLVAWLNAQNQIVVSPRYATDYVMPTPLSGPVITVLKDSGIVNGELKVNVRCQGCTSWAGSEGTQSIATSGFQLLAYAANSFTKPSTPSSASSSLGIHSIFGILPALEMADAQNSDYTSKVNAQLPGSATTTTTRTTTTTTRTTTTTTTTRPPTTTTTTTRPPTTTTTTTRPGTCSPNTVTVRTTITPAPVTVYTTVTGGQQQTTRTTTSTRPQTTTTQNGGSGAALYGQCGGQGWTGPTTCASGTCRVSNQYYSQCLP